MDKVGPEAGCGCLGGREAMGRARWVPGVDNWCIEVIPHMEMWRHLEDHGPVTRSAGATSNAVLG